MKNFIGILLCLLIVNSSYALPAKFLETDSFGRPRIQVTGPGDYYIFRAADGYDAFNFCWKQGAYESVTITVER